MDASGPVTVLASENQPLHDRIVFDRANALPEGSQWSDLKTYRRYARGRQRHTLTREQQHMLHGVLAHRFSDNISHKVVNETANRLELLRFQVADQAVSDFLAGVFIKCNLSDLSGDAHYATVRDGNHALGLSWHAGQKRPLVHRERWWDGECGVFVAYGDDGLSAYAVKEWTETGFARRTVYFDDRIERYINRDGSWQRFQLPGETVWPAPWLKRGGMPLHIPIIHLAAGSDDDTPYGSSKLDGGVLGLQDEINDVHRDVTMAARMTAFQMYWATGVAPAEDENGEPIRQEVGPGVMLENENENAHYGAFAAGDMSQLIAAHRMKIDAVSRNTDTPIHLITGGDWPSGEALLRSEIPLVAGAQKLATGVGPAWATAAHRTAELENVFGEGDRLNEDELITAVFAPPDKRDALTLAQIDAQRVNVLIGLQSLGWSRAALQRAYGLSDEEINAMAKERQTEQTADAEAGLLPAL